MSKKNRKTESTQKQEIDPQVAAESGALVNLFRLLAGGGYEPNRGVTVAGFTPKQEAAFDMGDQLASAFGFAVPERDPMPETETSALGIEGYRPSREFDAMEAGLSPEYLAMLDEFYKVIGTPVEAGKAPAAPKAAPVGMYANPSQHGRFA